MLSLFRQRGLSSVLYGIIIVGTIMTFVIGFRPTAGKRMASINEVCVARVRGRCIEPKDFSSAYRIMMPSRSVQLSRKLNLKRVALDGLVERELLDGEAKRLGISVTDDELTDQLYAGFIRVSVPAASPTVAQAVLQEMYQSYARAGLVSQEIAIAHLGARDAAIPVEFRDSKTKAFDMKTYERQVRNLSNRSTTEFREEQSRELLAAKMRDVVRDPVRVSESEAWQEYERRQSTATVVSIPVKETWAGRWAVEAKPAEAEAWARDHKEAYDAALLEHLRDDAPKAGRIRHILVKLAYGATDDEKAAALGKLSWAAARIKRGEAFAEVARDVSEDTGSAASGGDAGDKTDAGPFKAEPFKAAANGLKAGEMTSAAVETQFGYHLIAKDDPAKGADVENQVKRSLPRAMMAKARATDAANAVAKNIAKAMRGGKTAEQAVEDALTQVPRGEKIEMLRVAAASSTTRPDGGAEAAASVPPGNGPARPALGGKAFDGTTDPDRPQPVTSSAFTRGGDPFPGLSPEGTTSVVGFAFSAGPGDVLAAPVRAAEGFVVVQLKDQRRATRDEFGKDREAFEEEMVRAKRDEALALYVRRLRDHAKDAIKIDASYVEESKGKGTSTDADEEDL